MNRLLCFVAVAVFAVPALATAATVVPPPQNAAAVSGVSPPLRGRVAVRLGGADIALPNAPVVLRDARSNEAVARTQTNLEGAYVITRAPRGEYRVCAEPEGFDPACAALASAAALAPPLVVAPGARGPNDRPQFSLIHGRVTLADGAPCRSVDARSRVESATSVVAADARGAPLVKPVRANSRGMYVLPRVPHQAARVEARCDAAVVSAAIEGAAVIEGRAPLDLTIGNTPPQFAGVLAHARGREVLRTLRPTTLQLVADFRDADGDRLKYTWSTPDGGGTIVAGRDNTATWTLPDDVGVKTVYVIASDGKGGIARGRHTVQVGTDHVLFAARVTGPDGAGVRGASVSVNGVQTRTGASGAFSLRVPQSASHRYVTTVRAAEHVSASVVSSDGLRGRTIALRRAHVQVIDPRRASDVREPGEGARLHLPANALVDTQGKTARGRLRVSLATLRPAEVPGSGLAAPLRGEARRIDSVAPVFLEITDAAGRRYDLRRGATARLTVPIDSSRAAGFSEGPIASWGYDAATGYWHPTGGRARFRNNIVDQDTPTISQPFVDYGPFMLAGCLTIHRDVSVPVTYTLRISFKKGNPVLVPLASPDTLVPSLSSVNMPISLELLDDNQQVVATPMFAPASGLKAGLPKTLQKPVPRQICGEEVWVSLQIPPWEASVTGHSLESYVDNPSAQVKSYYGAVDPNAKRTKLGDWWGMNGFDKNTGAGGTQVAYLNKTELGVGRNVRCTSSGSDVACYAIHYGNPDLDPGNADTAAANNPADAAFTLAMEYKAVEGKPAAKRFVKFFAFSGAKSTSLRVNSVDLDGFGPKYVPWSCTACHGSRYVPSDQTFIAAQAVPYDDPSNVNAPDPSASPDVQASFREFNVASFGAPSGVVLSQAAFRTLNNVVSKTAPAPVIKDLVKGWYTDVPSGLPVKVQQQDYIPAGWAAQPELYSKVIAKSCRTCHNAFVGGVAYLDWGDHDKFLVGMNPQNPVPAAIYNEVCERHNMPYAWTAYRNFWLSQNPFQPGLLLPFLGQATCP